MISASLSARRAWIEISHNGYHRIPARVALRKESVDRNFSASAIFNRLAVALRKESVDRNIVNDKIQSASVGRSPQGERG